VSLPHLHHNHHSWTLLHCHITKTVLWCWGCIANLVFNYFCSH
jgi:hypothetical protein